MRAILALLLFASFTQVGAFAQGDVVVAAKKDGEVAVTVGGKPFTTLVAQKDGLAKPYLYPILAPNGTPVTRDWPMKSGTANETKDHVHQKSAWFCHGDVIPEGVELKVKSSDKRVAGVDFWAESKDHGIIAATDVNVLKSNAPNEAFISTIMEWRAPEGLVVLTEKRVQVFADRRRPAHLRRKHSHLQ